MEIVRGNPQPPFRLLDRMVTILATNYLVYPLLSAVGTDVWPYGGATEDSLALVAVASDEAGAVAVEAEFDPIPLNGIHAYYFDSSANNHLNVGDDDDLSFGNATTDSAFSLGAWIYPTSAFASAQSILAKFGTTAATSEEYDLRIDTSAQIVLELHDPSVPATEIATGADGGTVKSFAWNFICATYDGAQAAPDIHLYLDASDQNAAGTSAETGEYVAMEATGAGLLIGARDATDTPAQEFEGYMALPFIATKELTAAEVGELYGIGKQLIGL